MIEDTYFLNADEALRVASEQNRFGEGNNVLQICYYDGQKIDSQYKNLIYLPIDNLVDDLAKGTYRIPSKLDFTGLELSTELKAEILNNFYLSIVNAHNYREQYNSYYIETLKSAKLDFNEPLRFYVPANVNTQVMQYVSKNIADVLKSRGYDVLFYLYEGIEDDRCFKIKAEFNPHVTIGINHLSNKNISEDIFNFIWFQDPMPILHNDEEIHLRDRDYIFSYTEMFTEFLLKKGVNKEQILKQELIPVDPSQFFLDKEVDREDKIIFVGSYYDSLAKIDGLKEVDKALWLLLEKGESISRENIINIFMENGRDVSDKEEFINYIQQGYIRNACVTWMCDNKSKKVEVYGNNWEQSENPNIINNFHGNVAKDKLNKLYNSSKYILSASGRAISTQRLGEAVYSGGIPVMYDSRDISTETQTWDDECLYFKTKEELYYILDNNIEPKKYRSQEMLKYFTYDSFFKTIFELIDLA